MRIDWGKVRAESGGNELVLLALPRDGVRLLLSIIEPLEWKATFRTNGYDYSDWDAVQAIVAETHLGLMEHQVLSTIVSAIDKLTAAVENLSATICCVNPVSVSNPDVPLIGSGSGSIYDAPNPAEPPPYPFELQTWSDYRCRAGEFVYQRLRALAENADVVLSVTGSGVIAASVVILGLVAIGVTVPPAAIAIIPILDSIAAFLVALASSTDELLADVSSDDFHREFVCAFADATALQDVLGMPDMPVFAWVNGVTRYAMNVVLGTVGKLAWLGRGSVAGDEYIALDALPACIPCHAWTQVLRTDYWNGPGWGWAHLPANPLYTGRGWVGDAQSLRVVENTCDLRFYSWEGVGTVARINVSGNILSNPGGKLCLVIHDGFGGEHDRELEIESQGNFLWEAVVTSRSGYPVTIGLGSYVNALLGLEMSELSVVVDVDL